MYIPLTVRQLFIVLVDCIEKSSNARFSQANVTGDDAMYSHRGPRIVGAMGWRGTRGDSWQNRVVKVLPGRYLHVSHFRQSS